MANEIMKFDYNSRHNNFPAIESLNPIDIGTERQFWFTANMLADMFPESDKPLAGWKYTVLLCVGSFLPWMALDILQYDEFFLLPVYVLLGVAHVAGWDTPAESAETQENAD